MTVNPSTESRAVSRAACDVTLSATVALSEGASIPQGGLGSTVRETVKRLVSRMSKTNDTEKDDDGVRMRKQHSKTTNLVVYLDTEATDEREAAIDIGGPAYSEKELVVKDNIKVGFGDNLRSHRKWDYSDLPRGDTGDVSVMVDRNMREEYKSGTRTLVHNLVDDAEDELIQHLADETQHSALFNKLRDDDRRTLVKVRLNDLTTMGLIHHKPDVAQGEVWEDKDAEKVAFTITVECKDTSKQVIHKADNIVVDGLRDHLMGLSEVESCRYRACEVEETERGDCFDVFN